MVSIKETRPGQYAVLLNGKQTALCLGRLAEPVARRCAELLEGGMPPDELWKVIMGGKK